MERNGINVEVRGPNYLPRVIYSISKTTAITGQRAEVHPRSVAVEKGMCDGVAGPRSPSDLA